ncbi:MAG: hypothetical protein ACREBD_32415 [Blastocatellia bacterium]
MRTSRKLSHALFSLFALVMMSVAAFAADPGSPYPRESEVSDQKAGSVLFYNIYTSDLAAPQTSNTRINITNTSSTHAAFVHMYFVQDSCGVADAFICLTANQTASFQTVDLDPGVSGYIVAVAVDPVDGCPTSFNFLIGDLYIKAPQSFAAGALAPFAANLAAEAFSALAETFTPMGNCDNQSATASLIFNGANGNYNRAPLVLAVSNIPSPATNSTLLILNRVGGNLATTASTISRLFGLLYDDAENVFSFTIGTGACQFRNVIGANNIPRTTPRVASIIPPNRSGWMKIWNSDNASGLLGSVINSTASASEFNGGHNLHKLTLSPTNTYVVPVFPPSC